MKAGNGCDKLGRRPLPTSGRPILAEHQHRLVVRIDNLDHVRAAFGSDAACGMAAWLRQRMARLLGERGEVYIVNDAVLGAVIFPDGVHRTHAQAEAEGARYLEALLYGMSLSAFDVGGATAHPALCGQFATEAPAPDIAPDFSDVCEDAPAPPATAVGAEAQRADFSACEEVLAAIRQGRMTFSWSPVRNARAPDELLYLAATAWVTDSRGVLKPVRNYLPALERSGLVRLVDRYVCMRILDLIEETDRPLGVRISAASAICDAWWSSLAARLGRRPWAAAHLVIETSQTSHLVNLASFQAFVAWLRGLGGRIAIDDFGVSGVSTRDARLLSPDIIKIDGFFVRELKEAPHGAERLSALIQLLHTISPWVVVKGVATAEQAEAAEACGGLWQQGLFHRALRAPAASLSDAGSQ